MKIFIFKISIAILLLCANSSLYSHKEWVHQHQVRQAYLLLKQQLGFDIAILQNQVALYGSKSCIEKENKNPKIQYGMVTASNGVLNTEKSEEKRSASLRHGQL